MRRLLFTTLLIGLSLVVSLLVADDHLAAPLLPGFEVALAKLLAWA